MKLSEYFKYIEDCFEEKSKDGIPTLGDSSFKIKKHLMRETQGSENPKRVEQDIARVYNKLFG